MAVWFIQVRLGSLRRAKRSPGSSGFAWVHSGKPRGLGVLSSSRGFTQALIAIV